MYKFKERGRHESKQRDSFSPELWTDVDDTPFHISVYYSEFISKETPTSTPLDLPPTLTLP